MKKAPFFIALLLALSSMAQENEFGTLTKDSLILKNGARFGKGQSVKLGYGSSANKDFEFIHLSPYSMAGPLKLGSNWANATMTVKDFKVFKGKNTGTKVYLILKGGNLSPYWCDVVAAIDQKEIKVDLPSADKPSAGSLADELKKLKELYDSGAITKEEYEAAKKKLLEN